MGWIKAKYLAVRSPFDCLGDFGAHGSGNRPLGHMIYYAIDHIMLSLDVCDVLEWD